VKGSIPTLDLRLRSDPTAIADARHALEAIRHVLPSHTFDDVRLLVSELVTNSIRHAADHAADEIDVSVRVTGRTVHGEITDRGPGFSVPSPRAPATISGSGWGLYLLDRIADRWGTRSVNGRSSVWFDIDL